MDAKLKIKLNIIPRLAHFVESAADSLVFLILINELWRVSSDVLRVSSEVLRAFSAVLRVCSDVSILFFEFSRVSPILLRLSSDLRKFSSTFFRIEMVLFFLILVSKKVNKTLKYLTKFSMLNAHLLISFSSSL